MNHLGHPHAAPPPAIPFEIRHAGPSDLDAIVDFNVRLAAETEGRHLDLDVVTEGVRVGLNNPERLQYWVAYRTDDQRVIGQLAISLEWSDWRNGWIWWFQSVYVCGEARGQGVFRQLHKSVRAAALDTADVVGLRLYVEEGNEQAQSSYKTLGFIPGGYQVYEELWPARFGDHHKGHAANYES